MDLCRMEQLMLKPVINICNGNKIGYIVDWEMECCSGRIRSVIVPTEYGCFGLLRGEEIVIPWEKIQKIGDDSILVELSHAPDSCCRSGEGIRSKNKKKKFSFFGF